MASKPSIYQLTSLVQAAETIASRPQGGCAWLVPPPDSSNVMANGSVVVPAHGANSTVLVFKVPEGMRFSFRGFVFRANVTGWNQGSGDLFFTLAVTSGPAPRNVEFFENITTEMGRDRPYPVMGRQEFEPLDELTVTVFSVANVGVGGGNFVTAVLSGFLYPMVRSQV